MYLNTFDAFQYITILIVAPTVASLASSNLFKLASKSIRQEPSNLR